MSETTEPVRASFDLSEQLRLAQKMDLVGKMASGVAHEFNTLLSVILGYSDLVAASPTDVQRTYVEEIQRAAAHGAALTRQLLDFTAPHELRPVPLSLNAIITRMEQMLERLVGPQAELLVVLDPSLRPVQADAHQFEQVLVNLCLNARDAMPRGGRLTLMTANVDIGIQTATHPEVPPGSYVTLAIRDTGCGMDEATRARLFEPFFTTKEPGKGTGLGLANVRAILTQSGGRIVVSTEPGHGSMFTIYLPPTPEPVAAPPPAAQPAPTRDGTETILLLEPDEALRVVMRRILERKGYSILETRRVEEARLSCMIYYLPIRLVITEAQLPRQSGAEAARTLVSVRSEVRPLFLANPSPASTPPPTPESATLYKPFTSEDLARKVRALLDAG